VIFIIFQLFLIHKKKKNLNFNSLHIWANHIGFLFPLFFCACINYKERENIVEAIIFLVFAFERVSVSFFFRGDMIKLCRRVKHELRVGGQYSLG
jgi:hypothetical protein